MTPQSRAKNSIVSIQGRDNTDFEDIQHRGETLKAKVEHGDFRKIENLEIGNSFQDEISFLDIDITQEVERGDIVVYDSDSYKIEYFTKVFGLYKLFCLKESRYGGLR